MTEPASTSIPYVIPQGGDAWAADAAAMGKTGTQRLLAVEHGPPPSTVRLALDLTADDLTVVRRRVVLADGRPVELADSYYPAAIAVGTALGEDKKIKGGAISALTAAGHAIAELVETIDARLPTAVEAELLEVSAGEPVLVLSRVSRDTDGRAVECAVNVMIPGKSAPIVYRMRIGT